jgi:3-hydroxyisobutyrate dehydrogenase-like beta-hydroxyacid dehydrogenase
MRLAAAFRLTATLLHDRGGCPTPLFSLAREIHRSAVAQGHAKSDPAVVCKLMEQWAGIVPG